MKLQLTVQLLGAACLPLLWWGTASGQWFDDPSINFKPFKLEQKLRGAYNISVCIREVLNCWELLSPEVYCDNNKEFHDSYCTTIKNRCHDVGGPENVYTNMKKGFVAMAYDCEDEHGSTYT